MAATYAGSCKCGAIKVEMQGEPNMVGLCHCKNCRKSSGSTYSVNAIFPKSAFAIVSGEAKVYEGEGGSGEPAAVNFCGNCSASMWTTSPKLPDAVVVKAGILDGDGFDRLPAPMGEMFTSRKPSWVKSVDGAGQFEEGWRGSPAK